MRPFVTCLTLVAAIGVASDAKALSPEECRTIVTGLADIENSLQMMIRAFEHAPALKALSADLSTVKTQVFAADRTRESVIRALKSHTAAIQELGSRLQPCAG
jgi:hypothetical protein